MQRHTVVLAYFVTNWDGKTTPFPGVSKNVQSILRRLRKDILRALGPKSRKKRFEHLGKSLDPISFRIARSPEEFNEIRAGLPADSIFAVIPKDCLPRSKSMSTFMGSTQRTIGAVSAQIGVLVNMGKTFSNSRPNKLAIQIAYWVTNWQYPMIQDTERWDIPEGYTLPPSTPWCPNPIPIRPKATKTSQQMIFFGQRRRRSWRIFKSDALA